MKDRPAGDTIASSSTGLAVSLARRAVSVFRHFWKLLAVAGVAGGLWILHDTLARRSHDDPFETSRANALEPRSDDDGLSRKSPQQLRMLRDLIDKQSQPATIIFKSQAQAAVGYLSSVDDQWVVLRSFYKDEAKEQTVLIPWENILYIRLNTKVSPIEQDPIASRDPRVRTVDRVRR